MRSAYHFFDCRASYGMRCYRAPGSFYRKEDLLRKMSDYSIDCALVYHSLSKEYDPMVGNHVLCREIKDDKNLFPVWAVQPHYTGEFDTPSKLLEDMRANGVKALTMFPAPSSQNFSFAEFTCGEIFHMCEEHQIPFFVDMDQMGGIAAVDWLCAAHPKLPLVVTKVNYRIDRDLYPLLDKYRNFYIEISGYKPFEGIKSICERFGAGRLIFGTGMPESAGGAAVGLVTYADITDSEKNMIASGNLKKLLGGVAL